MDESSTFVVGDKYQHNDATYGGRCLGCYYTGATGARFYIIVLCHFLVVSYFDGF